MKDSLAAAAAVLNDGVSPYGASAPLLRPKKSVRKTATKRKRGATNCEDGDSGSMLVDSAAWWYLGLG